MRPRTHQKICRWLEQLHELKQRWQPAQANNCNSVCDDFMLEVIIEHWQTLVDKYRNIPIDVFTVPPAE